MLQLKQKIRTPEIARSARYGPKMIDGFYYPFSPRNTALPWTSRKPLTADNYRSGSKPSGGIVVCKKR
jgi:hypothetical protein